jgi:hypothetical protein
LFTNKDRKIQAGANVFKKNRPVHPLIEKNQGMVDTLLISRLFIWLFIGASRTKDDGVAPLKSR